MSGQHLLHRRSARHPCDANRFISRSLITTLIIIGITAWTFTAPHPLLAQDAVPSFTPADCPIDLPTTHQIDCGILTAPEDHSDPASGTIQMPVLIIHSNNPNPAPDPVIFTEGGPGYTSLNSVWWLSASPIVTDRDVIILEQRGNKYATPRLDCEPAAIGPQGDSSTPCLDSLRERGIDISHYTTQQSVEDIEALRVALDIESWNLYGSSYSTRLMLLTMRDHPENVRSVILDSVNAVDETRHEHDPEFAARALHKMFDDCAADPACAAAYPDLEASFYRLFSELNANPVSFTIAYDKWGYRLEQPITEEVTGYRLLNWMVDDALYGPSYGDAKTTYLPLLIDQVEAGRTRLLYPWLLADALNNNWVSDSGFSWGMYFAINCQSDYPSAPEELRAQAAEAYPELEGYTRFTPELEVCAAWGLPVTPLSSEPVRSDIPTLILAGGYDPVTAPIWGQTAAETLSSGYYFEFPSAGHGVNGQSACAREMQREFLANPQQEPDSSCMADEPSPEFVLPEDVLVAPGFSRSLEDINIGAPNGKSWLEAIIIGGVLVFLVNVIFLIATGIVRLARRKKGDEPHPPLARIAHILGGIGALLGVSILPLMSINIQTALAANSYITRFGLPADYTPAYFLGGVSLALAVFSGVLVILAVVSWVKRYWSLPRRIFFSLVAAVAVLFVVMIARWGLITMLL